MCVMATPIHLGAWSICLRVLCQQCCVMYGFRGKDDGLGENNCIQACSRA